MAREATNWTDQAPDYADWSEEGESTTPPVEPGTGLVGQPIGLLLAITYSGT